MSEYSNINLVLGIVGTVTGIIALFISYWTYRKENPRLKVAVLKCEHDFTLSDSQIKSVNFWATFQIKNIGDRGTSINDMGLLFRSNGREYHWKKKYFRGPNEVSEKRWIAAHDWDNIEADFYDTYEGTERKQIDCIFTIYHTHSSEKIRVVSQRRREKPKDYSM